MFRLLPRAKRASAALSSRFSAWNSKSRLSPAALASAVFCAAPASGAVGAVSAAAARGGGVGQLSNLDGGTWGEALSGTGALLLAPLLGRAGAASPANAAGVASKNRLRASRARPLVGMVRSIGFCEGNPPAVLVTRRRSGVRLRLISPSVVRLGGDRTR